MSENQRFDLERFLDVSRAAVDHAMQVIRPYQFGERQAKASIKTEDRSFVTPADKLVSAMMRRMMEENFPGMDHNIEDDEGSPTAYGSRYKIWGDPVDGTLPFALGAPTSTVIMGVHDTVEQRVLVCMIGEPTSGQLWYTYEGRAYVGSVDGVRTSPHVILPGMFLPREIKVWDGAFDKDAAVFLDNPRGFTRGKEKRPILSDEEMGRLIEQMRTNGRLQLYGSNGLYHALVAQGSEHDKVAGGITSAMGGCQDVMGVKLILDAGGSARAFTAIEGGFDEKSPEAVEQYDILVYGNNRETVDKLSRMVLGLRR